MSEQEPLTMTTAERLQKAEDRERKAAAHRDRLRRVSIAEAEVPNAYATGETSKQKLADIYGVSVATVTRILEVNGVQQTRVRHLSDEERKEIATLLGQGTTSLEIQAAYGVSHNTVRNIGLKFGVLKKGERKPQRSDEEYARIQELDQMAMQRFGAGIYNLGVGLRTWEAKQKVAAEGTQRDQQVNSLSEAKSSQPVNETNAMTPPPSPPLSTDEWDESGAGNDQPATPREQPAQQTSEPTPVAEDDFKF